MVAPSLSGRRLTGSSDSRIRKLHNTMNTDQTAQNQNTPRHGNTAMIAVPSDGARIGTSMNTAMICDIALAIAVPSKRSRMIAVATTRDPAAPIPQTKRLSNSSPNVGASAEPMAPIR